jgi:hypothetical protein
MKKYILIVIAVICTQNINSQILDRNYYLNISKAVGFYLGTKIVCDKIIKKYPTLSGKMMALLLDFENYHKNTKEKLMGILMDYGVTESDAYNNYLYHLKSKGGNNEISYTTAQDYITNFEKDVIKGDNENYSQYVKVLIQNNTYYKSRPDLEFKDGFTQLIKKNINLDINELTIKIRIPKSWEKIESDNSNILIETSNNTVTCRMLLGAKNYIKEINLKGKKLTEVEEAAYRKSDFGEYMYKNIFTSTYGLNFFKKINMDNVSEFEFEKTRINGNPGFIVKGYGNLKNGMENNYVYVINLIFIYNQYHFDWSFKIDSSAHNYKEKSKLEPLIKMIINSLNIESEG